MKAVILCGGQGTRIRDVSELIPKPMLPIGGKPILWHIMKLYSSFGVNDFVLCLGHKGWKIKEFFLNYQMMISDFTMTLGDKNSMELHGKQQEASWRITFAETGEDSMTGHRLWRVREYLKDDDHFCLTYGDGVADIDLGKLIEHHKSSNLIGTTSAVRLAGRFGEIVCDNGKVTSFDEKPALSGGHINGGFMVFDGQRFWDHMSDNEDLILEREPMQNLLNAGQLGYFEHEGFWQCMDTMREYTLLNELWDSGQAPWKLW